MHQNGTVGTVGDGRELSPTKAGQRQFSVGGR